MEWKHVRRPWLARESEDNNNIALLLKLLHLSEPADGDWLAVLDQLTVKIIRDQFRNHWRKVVRNDPFLKVLWFSISQIAQNLNLTNS